MVLPLVLAQPLEQVQHVLLVVASCHTGTKEGYVGHDVLDVASHVPRHAYLCAPSFVLAFRMPCSHAVVGAM